MVSIDDILERYPDTEFKQMDGFEDCIIGVTELNQSGADNGEKLIYSMTAIIESLQTNQGMSNEDAMEWYYFNIAGSSIGDDTPIICDDYF